MNEKITSKTLETDKAIISITFKNQSKEQREKVFNDIYKAAYELCKYESLKRGDKYESCSNT